MNAPNAELFPPILCTVDVVLLTLLGGKLCVGVLRRDLPPFLNVPALPGGYVHAQADADTVATAVRVLDTKLELQSPYLEQVATFSGPARDPRGWSVSIAYAALVPAQRLDSKAQGFSLVAVDDLPHLPFDHSAIVELAVRRVRNKSVYSSLPVQFCGEHFTLPELQGVYEAVLGEQLNKVSFRRKMRELDMLEPIEGELLRGNAHRPAQYYRLRPAYRRQLALSERGIGLG
jgi:8-oxo-dGTP diphosphatase